MKKQKFQYMRHPPELYNIQPQASQAFFFTTTGMKMRRIFNRVCYTSEQNLKIQQFKRFAEENKKTLDCQDKQILRYLYANNFVFKDTLEKISVYLDWTHQPAIQVLNNRARSLLNQGTVFTYGRDKLSRPIIYMDLSKIKLERYDLNEYYCALNAVMNVVLQQCFVPGVIQSYTFILDLGGKNFGLSIQALGKIIQKLSIVYSMYLGQLIALNTQSFIKFTYQGIKYFIHEETRKKVVILHCNQLQKLSDYIDKNQLYARYRGQNPDPLQYWPPMVPGLKRIKLFDEQTIYYSVDENDSFFLDRQGGHLASSQASCCDQCEGFQCQIF